MELKGQRGERNGLGYQSSRRPQPSLGQRLERRGLWPLMWLLGEQEKHPTVSFKIRLCQLQGDGRLQPWQVSGKWETTGGDWTALLTRPALDPTRWVAPDLGPRER